MPLTIRLLFIGVIIVTVLSISAQSADGSHVESAYSSLPISVG